MRNSFMYTRKQKIERLEVNFYLIESEELFMVFCKVAR